MLVTNPTARAPLTEVLSHPWMVRGFNGPPPAYLVHREPLRAEDLDRAVIKGMNGFEFGTEDDIERRLTRVLTGDVYMKAVSLWERKREGGAARNGFVGEGFSNSSLAISFDGAHPPVSTPQRGESSPLTKTKSKRFSGFEFYRRKLFAPSSSPPNSPLSNSPPTSQSQIGSDVIVDPTKGFHPLISMYFLAREKMERERVYGPGHFASSQLSITSGDDAPQPLQPPPSAAKRDKDTEYSPAHDKVDYSMALPRLPAPETSHYSGMSYDAKGNAPSSPPTTPASPGFPQPRARAVDDKLTVPKRADVSGGAPNTPAKPDAATHRRSHSLSQRPAVLGGLGGMFGGKEEGRAPKSAAPALGTFAEKEKLEEETEISPPREKASTFPSGGSPSGSASSTLARRFGSLLVGKADDTPGRKRMSKRATILGSFSPRPSIEPEREKPVEELIKEEDEKEKGTEEESEDTQSTLRPSQIQPLGTVHRRAATILDPHGRSARHERRSSMGATLLAGAGSLGGTIGRHRRPSTATSDGAANARNAFAEERSFTRTQEEHEGGEEVDGAEGFKEEDERHTREKDFKPVFLKGLFRCVTFPTT
jgi:hypothetical protein